MWKSQQQAACETYPLGCPPNVALSLGSWDSVFHGQYPEFADARAKTKHASGCWEDIVTEYTQCNVTKSEDKLVAVSGLAKKLQAVIGGEYFAGLWGSAIPQQLLWQVDPTSGPDRIVPLRPAQYRAPFWSWASLDGNVFFTGSIFSEERVLVKALEILVTPGRAENLYGTVTDGYITLECVMWLCKIDFDRGAATVTIVSVDNPTVELQHMLTVSVDLSSRDDVVGKMLFCVPVEYKEQERYTVLKLEGLILAHVEAADNTFCRVGYYEEAPKYAGVYYTHKAGRQSEKRVITIV